jgi:nucleoside-diphosphate-sugar epimerase
MKKILVTGATGFIGNLVIKELLMKGYLVITTSSNEEKAKQFSWYNAVTYKELNLQALDVTLNYFEYFGQPDLLIHLAWEGLPNYRASFHEEVNLPRHFLLLNNLIENGLKDLAVAGTCLEYGMREGCLSEEMEAAPTVPYAIAKNNLRIELEKLCSKKKVHFKWIRLFYMFGKGQNPNSLFAQLEKAIENKALVFNMSGGEQERDFLPVEQMVKTFVDIATQLTVEGIINCCSGQPVKVKKLVENILLEKCSTLQLNLGYYPYTDYEPMQFWGNTTKLKKITHHD